MAGKRGSIIINEQQFRDKVMGCWLGKNAGGTLGEPLEMKFGRAEMFDVSWYPDLPEGGIPNDDLELQLIWLQALQERGPGLTARDLSEYWLDCIAYNFDEYGLSRTNLQKGLIPPVSGWHNNWFKDCMGSPIRSEIWACVAPGVPDIAARYAYQDAICDHAGGESVYGEVFNAVAESAAFIETDKYRLIETGLRAIPENSQTYHAIRYATDLHAGGVDWKEARNRVMQKFYHPVAQHSPINLGFQIIGWLYGEDFGDSICKAVNCGWDTDCTGATVGALQGIVYGAKQLPERWMKPLNDRISTNLGTGGIKNLKVPTDIGELTDQVVGMAKQVLHYWNANVVIMDADTVMPDVERIEVDMAWAKGYKPNAVEYGLGSVNVSVAYEETAAITGDSPTLLKVLIANPHPEPIFVEASLQLPKGWQSKPTQFNGVEIAAYAHAELPCTLQAPGNVIEETNVGYLQVRVRERPALPAVPIVLLGGSKWLVSEVIPNKGLEDACGMVEDVIFTEKPAEWRETWRPDNDLNVEPLFNGQKGIVYMFHAIYSELNQDVVIGVANSNRMKIWVNGQFLHQTKRVLPVRPNQGNGGAMGDGSNYANTTITRGWNQILIKLERGNEPLDAHFMLGSLHPKYPKNHGGAVLNIARSRFSWE